MRCGCSQLQTTFWPSLLLGPYLQTRGPLTAGALEAAVGGPGLYLPLYHPAEHGTQLACSIRMCCSLPYMASTPRALPFRESS